MMPSQHELKKHEQLQKEFNEIWRPKELQIQRNLRDIQIEINNHFQFEQYSLEKMFQLMRKTKVKVDEFLEYTRTNHSYLDYCVIGNAFKYQVMLDVKMSSGWAIDILDQTIKNFVERLEIAKKYLYFHRNRLTIHPNQAEFDAVKQSITEINNLILWLYNDAIRFSNDAGSFTLMNELIADGDRFLNQAKENVAELLGLDEKLRDTFLDLKEKHAPVPETPHAYSPRSPVYLFGGKPPVTRSTSPEIESTAELRLN